MMSSIILVHRLALNSIVRLQMCFYANMRHHQCNSFVLYNVGKKHNTDTSEIKCFSKVKSSLN